MDDLSRPALRTLVELGRRGTMAAVADQLGYTAGAVSQQLARLEQVVGRPLVLKVGRGVRLTDAGRVLAEHAVELLRIESAALAAARATATEATGRVTLGVFGSTAGALLAPLVLRLAADSPGLTVLSREIGVDDSAAAVQRGDVDLAFGVDYPLAAMSRESSTELVRLRSERFALAVPDSWQLRHVVSLAEAERWPWILTPASTPFGRAVRSACRAAGFEPDVVHEVTDTAVSVALASRGLGVTPVTPLMQRLVGAPVRVQPLTEQVERQLLLVRHRADRARPTVVAVSAAVQAVVDELLPG